MARLAKNGGPHSGVRRRTPPRHHGRRLARQTAARTACSPNAVTSRWRTACTSIPTACSAPASSARKRGISPAAESRCSSARALARSSPCPRSSDEAGLACSPSKPRSTCSSPTYPWPSCSASAKASLITSRASGDSLSHMPSPPAEAQRVLVVHGLLGNPQPPGDIPPGPALRPGVTDLQLLQHLDEPAQRHHGSESGLGIRTCGSLDQPPRLPQFDTHVVKLA